MFEKLKETLQLERPIVFFDLETTGVDIENDRIVEFGYLKLFPSGEMQSDSFYVNPGIPIPAEATAVHGIKDEDVASSYEFGSMLARVSIMMRDCDLCGHNVRGFDIPLLLAEFKRHGFPAPQFNEIVDTLEIFRAFFNHKLESAYRIYVGGEMEGAHGAQADVDATAMIFAEMVRRHGLDPNPSILGSKPIDPTWLDREGKFKWVNGEAVFTFGKVSGQSLQHVARTDRGYMDWMLTKDFSEEVDAIILDALRGTFPVMPDD
jgi:DNA polymerase-3 subunit epsilon